MNDQNMNNENFQYGNGGNPALNSFNNQPVNNTVVGDTGNQPMGMNNQNLNMGSEQSVSGGNPAINDFNNQPVNNSNFYGVNPQPMNTNPNQMPNQNMNYGPQPMNGMNQQYNNSQNNKKTNPLFIAIPVVVVLAIIGYFGFTLLFGNNYKSPIKTYCKAMNDLDGSLMKEVFPKEFLQEEGYDDLVESLDYLKETIKEYDAKYSVTCEIKDGVKLDSEDLKDLNEEFKDEFNTTRKITEAYYVDVKHTTLIEYDGDSNTDTGEDTFTVGKIGGKWYLLEN